MKRCVVSAAVMALTCALASSTTFAAPTSYPVLHQSAGTSDARRTIRALLALRALRANSNSKIQLGPSLRDQQEVADLRYRRSAKLLLFDNDPIKRHWLVRIAAAGNRIPGMSLHNGALGVNDFPVCSAGLEPSPWSR